MFAASVRHTVNQLTILKKTGRAHFKQLSWLKNCFSNVLIDLKLVFTHPLPSSTTSVFFREHFVSPYRNTTLTIFPPVRLFIFSNKSMIWYSVGQSNFANPQEIRRICKTNCFECNFMLTRLSFSKRLSVDDSVSVSRAASTKCSWASVCSCSCWSSRTFDYAKQIGCLNFPIR